MGQERSKLKGFGGLRWGHGLKAIVPSDGAEGGNGTGSVDINEYPVLGPGGRWKPLFKVNRFELTVAHQASTASQGNGSVAVQHTGSVASVRSLSSGGSASFSTAKSPPHAWAPEALVLDGTKRKGSNGSQSLPPVDIFSTGGVAGGKSKPSAAKTSPPKGIISDGRRYGTGPPKKLHYPFPLVTEWVEPPDDAYVMRPIRSDERKATGFNFGSAATEAEEAGPTEPKKDKEDGDSLSGFGSDDEEGDVDEEEHRLEQELEALTDSNTLLNKKASEEARALSDQWKWPVGSPMGLALDRLTKDDDHNAPPGGRPLLPMPAQGAEAFGLPPRPGSNDSSFASSSADGERASGLSGAAAGGAASGDGGVGAEEEEDGMGYVEPAWEVLKEVPTEELPKQLYRQDSEHSSFASDASGLGGAPGGAPAAGAGGGEEHGAEPEATEEFEEEQEALPAWVPAEAGQVLEKPPQQLYREDSDNSSFASNA